MNWRQTGNQEVVKVTILSPLAVPKIIVHYNDVIMSTMATQITSLTIVYSSVYSDTDQRKHQSSASLAFVRGIHRWPVNSPHKGPVTRKMFPFDEVIMWRSCLIWSSWVTILSPLTAPKIIVHITRCPQIPRGNLRASSAWISNYITETTVGCNYWSMPDVPTSAWST